MGETKFINSYATIIKELDTSSVLRYMYYPVFLIRRAIWCTLLVLFSESPLVQIGLMSALALSMTAYVVFIRPQKEKLMFVLTVYSELILVFMHLLTLVFMDSDQKQSSIDSAAYTMLAMTGLYMMINWGIVIGLTIREMMSKWRARKLQNRLANSLKSNVDVEKSRFDLEKERQRVKLQDFVAD